MNLVFAKAWYICYFGGLACVWPFLNLLYRDNGLTDAQIGVLAAVKPWVSAPASFVWSGLADRFAVHKPLLLATFVSSTVTRTAIGASHSFAAFLALAIAGEALAAPVGVMADAAVVAACARDSDYGKVRLWGAVGWGGVSAVSGWVVSRLGMGAGFAGYLALSVPCVVCATRMEFRLGGSSQQQQQQQTVEKQKQQLKLTTVQQGAAASEADDEGEGGDVEQQRLLPEQQATSRATIGGPADRQLLQKQPAAAQLLQKQLAPDGSVAAAGDVGAARQHQQQQEQPQPQLTEQAASSSDNEQQQQQQQQDFWRGLRQLLSTPAVLVFMGQATVMGFGIGVIGEFLFLFLQELGGSEALMGLTLTFTCLAEVPMFQLQGELLQRISVAAALHLVLATYVLRLGLYACLPHLPGCPWVVLPIELLHGITFGLGWGAGTVNSRRVAPPALAATMQGIFQGLYFGLGQGLGALAGGLLKQRFGGQAMFAQCAAIVAAGWAACAAAEQAVAARERSSDGGGGGCGDDEQQQQGWVRGAWAAAAGWLARHVPRRQHSDWPAAAGERQGSRRQRYAQLSSKDSGPDLSGCLAT